MYTAQHDASETLHPAWHLIHVRPRSQRATSHEQTQVFVEVLYQRASLLTSSVLDGRCVSIHLD
jgi:hypothetical protein